MIDSGKSAASASASKMKNQAKYEEIEMDTKQTDYNHDTQFTDR